VCGLLIVVCFMFVTFCAILYTRIFLFIYFCVVLLLLVLVVLLLLGERWLVYLSGVSASIFYATLRFNVITVSS